MACLKNFHEQFQNPPPKGPLDIITEINGVALETLFLQDLRAIIGYYEKRYTFH